MNAGPENKDLAANLPATTSPAGGPEAVDVRTGMFGVRGTGDTSGFGGLVRTITMPGSSPRPYGSWFDEVVDLLAEVLAEQGIAFDQAVGAVVVDRGELTLHVARENMGDELYAKIRTSFEESLTQSSDWLLQSDGYYVEQRNRVLAKG